MTEMANNHRYSVHNKSRINGDKDNRPKKLLGLARFILPILDEKEYLMI